MAVAISAAILASTLCLGAVAMAQTPPSAPAALAGAQMGSLEAQFAPGSVWIEGEGAAKTNVPPNGWLKGDNLKLLSGGDALAGLVKPAALPSPCYALYKFDCPAAGNYDLYIRHGYMGNIGAMRYRFVKLGDDGKPVARPADDEGWVAFNRAATIMDRQTIGLYRTIEWTQQPRVALEKGTYYLDLQVTGANPGKASDPQADIWILIDAICLTTQPVAAAWTPVESDKPTTATVTATPTSAVAAKAAPTFVWVEGEAAEETNVPTDTGGSKWLKGDYPKMLSGGDALAGFIKPGTLPSPCFARYRFDSPAERTYDIYMRHGTIGALGAMRYRFVKLGDDGKAVQEPGPQEGWLRFDADVVVLDHRHIGKDRGMEWTKQQQVRLSVGPYRLDLQVTGLRAEKSPTSDLWILIDAICLTTPGFEPSGTLKPGEEPKPEVPVVDYY